MWSFLRAAPVGLVFLLISVSQTEISLYGEDINYSKAFDIILERFGSRQGPERKTKLIDANESRLVTTIPYVARCPEFYKQDGDVPFACELMFNPKTGHCYFGRSRSGKVALETPHGIFMFEGGLSTIGYFKSNFNSETFSSIDEPKRLIESSPVLKTQVCQYYLPMLSLEIYRAIVGRPESVMIEIFQAAVEKDDIVLQIGSKFKTQKALMRLRYHRDEWKVVTCELL